ncbi:AMP-binding protein [Maricurvus nonylphenolicus]|uniref:AMP-binding protein n=1 Tax=Maricurvus nonylphenolicus TaxID=1008307 RepID=UPI0036F316DB
MANVDSAVSSSPGERDLEQLAQDLLNLTRTMVQELRRDKSAAVNVSLDCTLDRDLGFDSLALTEMIQRVEQHFKVHLPQQIIHTLETPRDFLREIVRAGSALVASAPESHIQRLSLGEADPAPDQVRTLQEVLAWHLRVHPERPHIYLYNDDDQLETITYADLHRGAQQVAAGLLRNNLEPGQAVALMLPTGRDYFDSFFGILLARGIPVPIYPPARPSQLESHLRRHANILNNAQVTMLLTVSEAKIVGQLLKAQVPELKGVYTLDDIRQEDPSAYSAAITGEQARELDIAFLQYTSGSTGSPKGVILSHANLLANIRAMGKVMQVDATDVFVSWLPLYHDMGLIASWLASLYFAIPLVSMSPLLFLTRPQRWLWAIHTHRGTLSASPNFGYELCLRTLEKQNPFEGLDLSSWRAAFNGAEPVSPSTITRFTEAFACYGFRPEAMAPVYGLAESSVGLALPPLGRAPLIDRVQRQPLMNNGQAQPAHAEDSEALQFVAAGQPLPNHQVRIVDEAGRELPERTEGRLEFCGPSATSGYYRNAEATAKLFSDKWLDSGDRAYMAEGDIFITGRSKDIIIRAGRNLYPHELEEKIGNIDGIRKGCVAVFASKDKHSETETLVVLAETREDDETVRAQLRESITELCIELMETPPDDIVLAPPYAVPKTSSGKIRRAASRENYEKGEIIKPQRAVWLQLLRVSFAGIMPLLRGKLRQSADLIYAVYCWLLLVIIAPPVWLILALLPSPRLARRLVSLASRMLLKLSGTAVELSGLDKLSKGMWGSSNTEQRNCILVANHASYLDGLVLLAYLPLEYSFVGKVELRRNFFARIFLSRLETKFVERFDLQKGVADARDLAKDAVSGRSLLFFPEGTFTRIPGLREFHMGAFVAACDAGAAVIPVTLRGTRSKLRETSGFPRRGGVGLIVGDVIMPEGKDWNAALRLSDRARAEIQKRCGEPDLAT